MLKKKARKPIDKLKELVESERSEYKIESSILRNQMFKIVNQKCTPDVVKPLMLLKANDNAIVRIGETKTITLGVKIDHEALKRDLVDYDFFVNSHIVQVVIAGNKHLSIPNGVEVVPLTDERELSIQVTNFDGIRDIVINVGDIIAKCFLQKIIAF